MSCFYIKYADRCVPITGLPTIQELNQQVSSLFGVRLPGYSYLDEDSETIQVDIQLELNEAVRFLTETQGELLVEEKSTGTLQFIEELPLLRSQITIDEIKEDSRPTEKKEAFNEKDVEESQVIQQIRSENSSSGLDSIEDFEELKETSNNFDEKGGKALDDQVLLIGKAEDNELVLEKGIGNDERIQESEKVEYQAVGIDQGNHLDFPLKNDEKAYCENLQEDDEFPEITFEKEDISVDLELIRSVIRDEIFVSRSGRFVIHNRMCSKCKAEPIVGPMYKCNKCYYFVCEACEENSFHTHPLLKLKEPEKIDKQKEMIERISKELRQDDKGKIKDALEKYQYDYEQAVNYLLGLII